MDYTPSEISATTVLIIEDSPVVQHLMRMTLAPMELNLLFAEDGERGLELARTYLPDLITIDIGLPGLDGWGVLAELRADAATDHIPVIVITAHAQKSVQQTATDSGADGFFPKPFQPAELRRAAGALLERTPVDAEVKIYF